MSPEIIFAPPEEDESVIKMVSEGLYEVPDMARRGCPFPKTLNIEVDPEIETAIVTHFLAGFGDHPDVPDIGSRNMNMGPVQRR